MTPKIRRFADGSICGDELFDGDPTQKAIDEVDGMSDAELEAELADIGIDPKHLGKPKAKK